MHRVSSCKLCIRIPQTSTSSSTRNPECAGLAKCWRTIVHSAMNSTLSVNSLSQFYQRILSFTSYEELNKTGPIWPEETLICFFSTRPWFRAKFWRYQTLHHSVPPQVSWHKPVYLRHFPWMECPCAPQCVRQEKSGRPCLRIYHRWVNLGSSLCQDGRSHPVDIDKPGRGNIHSRHPATKK